MSKTTPSQGQKDPVALRNARLRLDPTCSKCGITKTVADFPVRDVCYWCSECRRKYAISLYHKLQKRKTEAEKQVFREKVNRKRTERLAKMSSGDLEGFRTHTRRMMKASRDTAKHAAYMGYGGYKCACCGETEPKFLSIDHVNNDGGKHRREARLKTSEQLYRLLVRENFPAGFQILCMNCQWGKKNNGGVCPHSDKV